MDIESKIRDHTKVTLTIGLAGNTIRHIRIVANSIEARDLAMARVRRVLPSIEMLEELLQQEPPQEDPDGSSNAGNTAAVVG